MFQILGLSNITMDPEETKIITATVDGDKPKRLVVKGERHVILLLDQETMHWINRSMHIMVDRSNNTTYFNPNRSSDKKEIEEIDNTMNHIVESLEVLNT